MDHKDLFFYTGPIQQFIACHMGDHDLHGTKCNIISEQPMFYIDDANADKESALFNPFFDELIDDDFLAELQIKLDSYEDSSRVLKQTQNIADQTYFDNCFFNTKKKSQIGCLDALKQSNLFMSVLDDLNKKGIRIEDSSTTKTAVYDEKKSLILINPALKSDYRSLKSVTGELRKAWLFEKTQLPHLSPDKAILMNRIQVADQNIFSIEILWELRLAGHHDLWNEAMSSSDHDLILTYAIEAMTNFRSVSSGLAARATFEKWFISSRCKLHDRYLIQGLLADSTPINLENDQQNIADQMVVMIAAHGERMTGRNYLSPIASQIESDTLYTEIRDRSNANFLWFLTFEKNFQEMEQNLHKIASEKPLNSSEIASRHDQPEASILSFPAKKRRRVKTSRKTKDDATIFFLDHFRAML